MTKQLITSALPYINSIKHLGNLIGSILPSDVYARYLRQRGEDVLFICATDDHGTPAELGAAKENMSTKEFCDIKHKQQADIYKEFKISFDNFGRTSCDENIEITQEFGRLLFEKGLAEVRTISQIYSYEDKRFLPDRYVEGTCPHCGYENARGDQCENCTKVLDPTDLINPRSAISGSTNLETKETSHLFLLQSKISDDLRVWVDKQQWPHLVKSIAYKWLDEGVQDRCITRDLNWGVPVTGIDGLEGKVYYVWFDAPIGYIGATKEIRDDWRNWWSEDADVRLTQFMGKDNIPFHTVSFPATLIGLANNWKKVDYIKGLNWLTFYGGKFSTSQRRGVFTDQALAELPSDYWRYYLISRAPENDDSSFTWEDLQTLANKDLADVLGNFVSRCLKMTEKQFSANVPADITFNNEADKNLITDLKTAISEYQTHLDNIELRKSAFALRQIWALGNEYFAKTEPWFVIKEDKERAAEILAISINLIRIFAVLSSPIIPDAAQKLKQALNLDIDLNKTWIDCDNLEQELTVLAKGHAFNIPENLFAKIDDTRLEELIEKFKGNN
jgi:methionyl-tRNA synthetase